MKKNVLGVVKKIVFAFVMLYTMDLLLANLNLYIPINLYTVGLTTILGPFGLLSLIIISYIL